MNRVPAFVLPDLCDAQPDSVRAAEPVFASFGGVPAFHGPIRTIRCYEDNSLVAERVREPGNGAVLVIDGGGSKRCALVGDNLARHALEHGWAGLIVYGCVRDVDELAQIAIGIQALAAHPLRSIKRGVGRPDETVTFAGLDFVPGQYLYADRNGIVVTAQALENL